MSILDGATVLAKHPRSYDKAKQIECAEHIEQLIERKKGARLHRGQSRLTHAIDCACDFLNAAAVHGYSLGSTTNNLLSLLDDYGASELAHAMADALARGVPHANAVRLSLQRRQDEREQPPLVVLPVSNDKRINELIVKPHKLSDYDVLNQPELMEEP